MATVFQARLGFDDWVAEELPISNSKAFRGEISVDDFMRQIYTPVQNYADFVLDAIAERPPWLTRDWARRHIQCLAFPVSSAARHFKAQGKDPDEGVSNLGRAGAALWALGRIADHPARDSAYTYWTSNDARNKARPEFMFTCNPQEGVFNRAVNDSNDLWCSAGFKLRTICRGAVRPDDPESAELLRGAADEVRDSKAVFMGLMSPIQQPSTHWSMTPAYFMDEYRGYLVAYTIHGRMLDGVSAANLRSPMSLDYLAGTTNDEYASYVRHRSSYFPLEEREALYCDMALPSVADSLIDHLGVCPSSVTTMPHTDLKAQIHAMGPNFVETLRGYKKFVTAWAGLSAFHYTLVQNYLRKPAARMTPEQRAKLTVDPALGTGGSPDDELIMMREMRRRHPIITALIECV